MIYREGDIRGYEKEDEDEDEDKDEEVKRVTLREPLMKDCERKAPSSR